MKGLIFIFIVVLIFLIGCSPPAIKSVKLSVQQVAFAPEPVTNNAVSNAVINNGT